MNWVALRMLTGDRSKYLGIVFGIAFATLLMAQQSAIFCGLMRNTTSQILDLDGADIWVMDPNVRFVDDIKPLRDPCRAFSRSDEAENVKWRGLLQK